MTPSIWIDAGMFAAAAGILLVVSFVPVFLQWRAERFAYQLGLVLPESQYHTVRTRLARRFRGIAIGALVGSGAAALSVPRRATGDPDLAGILLAFGCVIAGIGLGVAVASVWRPVPRDPDRVTIARAESVQLRDYVAPVERQGARVVVVISVVLVVAVFAFEAQPSTVLAGVLSALAIAALVFFEVMGRRITARPQPASSRAELEWDDALRSAVLRDIVTVPLALGVYSSLLSVAALSGVTDIGAFTGISALGLGVAAVIATAMRPHRYFLRRLWDGARA